MIVSCGNICRILYTGKSIEAYISINSINKLYFIILSYIIGSVIANRDSSFLAIHLTFNSFKQIPQVPLIQYPHA
ncbi:hypothetical protein CDV26_07370 [Francisella halioticida]|uniref:Uncharacterized protein n=1 Tax=Francisella halioticida TaxID=549298 RepID=A0ABM6LZX9_9GAMM|nr:hypothetical protein CDV26_07370 [Francisella halioticida]